MRKNNIIFLIICTLFLTDLHTSGMPAYPLPITITQPDQSTLTIILKGDENVKWALSEDGYTLLRNSEGFYEYAKLSPGKDLISSGIPAHEIGQRSTEEIVFLESIPKGLLYSPGQVLRNKSTLLKSKTSANKAFPTTGSRKLLCILIGYSDLAFTKSREDFEHLFNQIDYSSDGASGSVRDYYKEVSWDKLDLTTDIAGPYSADHYMRYYGGNDDYGYDENPDGLIREAIDMADSDVDFSDYDNDNDGYVDGIYVIFAGYGEEAGASANAIWSHAWSVDPVVRDGVTLSNYSCSPEHRGNIGSGISRIGVICHEFGHVLGAPDFYDTDYSESGGDFIGTGRWDIMADGSWNNNGASPAHHNPFTKAMIYNWTSANDIEMQHLNLSIKGTITDSTSIFKYNTSTNGEYYLLESRFQEGFDAYIPGNGLLIYHVHSDLDLAASANEINIEHPQKLYTVCASARSNPGSLPLSYGLINSAGCPFPGSSNQNEFTDESSPGSKSWSGENTGKPITNITLYAEGDSVIIDFMASIGDDCSDPLSLSGIKGSIDYSTTSYNDLNNGSCFTNSSDIVFKLHPEIPSGGTLCIKVSEADYNAVIFARRDSCDGPEIGCINSSANDSIYYTNTSENPQEIWIFCDGNLESGGNATLSWEMDGGVIAGENCSNPILLQEISGAYTFNTLWAEHDFSSESCLSEGSDLVFELEQPIPRGYILNCYSQDSEFDVVLYARMGSCSGIELDCIDGSDGSVLQWKNNTPSELKVWIVVDAIEGDFGKSTMYWEVIESSVTGENCEDPIIISGETGSEAFTTEEFLQNSEGTCHASGKDIVYLLSTPVPRNHIFETWTESANYIPIIYATYENCNGIELDCIESTGVDEKLIWTNTTSSSQNVWIFVDGNDVDEGIGELNWVIKQPDDIKFSIENDINIYPNPSRNTLHVNSRQQSDILIQEITIYTTYGAKVLALKGDLTNTNQVIDLSGFPIGSYIINIKTNNSMIKSQFQLMR